jgi:PRTRC genetic system ThiF family protein
VAERYLDTHCNMRPVYWLDIGNKYRLGQAVLGEFYYPTKDFPGRLPLITERFPEILDTDIPEENTASCSLSEAVAKQDLFINPQVATWGLHILWRLLTEGFIEHCGYFVNLEQGLVVPIPITRVRAVDIKYLLGAELICISSILH